jgi:hypothetical protein
VGVCVWEFVCGSFRVCARVCALSPKAEPRHFSASFVLSRFSFKTDDSSEPEDNILAPLKIVLPSDIPRSNLPGCPFWKGSYVIDREK